MTEASSIYRIAPESFLRHSALQSGDSTGIVWNDARFSYAALAGSVDILDAALRKANRGANPSSVTVAIPNRPVWLPLLQAVWDLGARAVLSSPRLPLPKLLEQATEQRSEVLVVLGGVHDPQGLAAWSGGLVTVDESLSPVAVTPARTTAAPGRTDEPGIVLFTSGTTGAPRPVPVSTALLGKSVESTMRQFKNGAVARSSDGTANLLVFPLYHISGVFQMLISTYVQRPLVLLERFTVDGFVRALDAEPIPHVLINPTMMRQLLDARNEHMSGVLSRLTTVRSGTAPLPRDLREEFEQAFGVAVLQGYGSTETVGEIAGMTLRDRKVHGSAKDGSVGRPHPATGLEIRDPAGAICAPGQPGEIWVRSPTTHGTFISTKDLGYLDEDGYLFVEGRIDDLINCGGFKIAPARIERVLRSAPQVCDCAVVGEPDRTLGQVPVAYVELTSTNGDTLDELHALCRANLAAYECPRRIRVVDRLPRNEIGKLLRRKLG